MLVVRNCWWSLTLAATIMILHVLVFILLNNSDAQDVRTVSRVSVQEGKSIIIPCWYNQKYVQYVKYLSAGNSLASSKFVVRSDDQSKHNTVSIVDNKTLNIVTVEMRSVLKRQTGIYWCGIELSGRDVGEGFYLKVIPGISGLYVPNQMLTGFETGSVTTSYHHHEPRKRDEKWCKLGGDCMNGASGSLDGASVEVTFSSGLMTVTMSKLKKENTGWYWCYVKQLQIPVHITVTTRRETIETTTAETISKQPTSSSSVQYLGACTSPHTPHQRETPVLLLMILGIMFVLMMMLSCTAVIFCKKKQNPRKQQTNTDSEETNFRVCERQPAQLSQADGDYEVIYASVSFKEH